MDDQNSFKDLAMKTARDIESRIISFDDLDTVKRMAQNFETPNFGPTYAELNLASNFYKILVDEIGEFNQSIDSEHEVGLRLASFGSQITFYIEDMRHADPSFIIFSGVTDGTRLPVRLIQHVSQINVLLMKMPKLNPDKPKRHLGFLPPPSTAT